MISKRKWKHDELLRDLADHLAKPERMMWLDMQLGPSGSPRPDIFTIAKSYTKPKPLAYEVKVSVPDFRSDVTAGKWQQYLKFASGVIFCVPKGLITKADIPPTCGLMVRSEKSWRTIRGPTLNPVSIEFHAMQKLLINGFEREYRLRRKEWQGRHHTTKSLQKQLGDDICDALRDLDAVRDSIARLKAKEKLQRETFEATVKKERDTIRANAERELDGLHRHRRDLCECLGIPPDSHRYQIIGAITQLSEKLSSDEMLENAGRLIERAEQSLHDAKRAIAPVTPPTPPEPDH